MSLAEQVVLLANELIVVQHVQLLASAQLFPTNTTRKAVQVEHLVPGFSHEVRWRQPLSAAPAFRSVSPAGRGQRDRNRLILVVSAPFSVYLVLTYRSRFCSIILILG